MFLIVPDAAEYLEDVYTIIKQPTGKPKTIQTGNFPKCLHLKLILTCISLTWHTTHSRSAPSEIKIHIFP